MSQDPHTHNTVPAANASFLSQLQTFLENEDANRFDDLFYDTVIAGGTHGTVGSLTASPAALTAYPGGHYITETGSITYADNETTWVVATKGITGGSGNFTRVAGTHYMIDSTSASKPSLPADSVWLMEVTTSGGSITAVTDLRTLSPVVIFGETSSDFPAAGTRTRLGWAEDEKRLYVDDGSAWVKLPITGDLQAELGEFAAIASAATLTLPAVANGAWGHVTGTNTISAISGSQKWIWLVFDAVLTLTNGASFILPDSRDWKTEASAIWFFLNEGSGVWRGFPLTHNKGGVQGRKGADIASAATLQLVGDGDYFDVTGSTGITAISTRGAGAIITLHFDASPPLTHSDPGLALPAAQNYTPVAGDEMTFRSEGGGNWRCIGMNTTRNITETFKNKTMDRASGSNIGSLVDSQEFTANGTWTKPSGVKTVKVICVGAGGGGGGGDSGTNRAAGTGGGGGAYAEKVFDADDLGATELVTVGTGGTGGAGTSNGTAGDGTVGGDSEFGTNLVKAFGGGGGQGQDAGSGSGGGGGGWSGAGGLGQESANSTGGGPGSTAGADGTAFEGAGGVDNDNGKAAVYGGGAGGGNPIGSVNKDGGTSMFGGGGGGGGGDNSAAQPDGGDGGDVGIGLFGSGGGGAGSTSNGVAGSAGASGGTAGGQGGGGGRGNANGGAGGVPGGGGGGGGNNSSGTGGTGGAGGDGRVWVISW